MSTSPPQPPPKRPPKPKPLPPITLAISSWLDTLPSTLLTQLLLLTSPPPSSQPSTDTLKRHLLSTSPTRFLTYPPLLLLPSGSFSSTHWTALLSLLTPSQSASLWTSILSIFPGGLTHLAVNSGIPPVLPKNNNNTNNNNSKEEEEEGEKENTLRSPTNLVPLCGGEDLDKLWVSTKQNGLTQVWAPAHTMFSRGNVKEKARVLNFSPPPTPTAAGKRAEYAVDLYAGIGYFVFSYAKLGFGVVGFELNPWSVEGLRRGAAANRFGVSVVAAVAVGEDEKKKKKETEELDQQIVVFEEDNRHAVRRIKEMGIGAKGERIKHVNCGFLPTSEPVWRDALGIVRTGWDEGKEEGRLHLHENVGVEDIEGRRKEVDERLRGWVEGEGVGVKVEHCELVKTYAPGVWHLVWDVRVWRG
ncbi:putative tRNA wybutosine-synthesizing protein 2 [Cladorrhinum sp. PSN332]|nr:putative tRNA wybutosine-synthesizing protein 2 [Cladorrhinum sp. PSN332]